MAKTYDPKNAVAIFAGTQIEGFAADTFISIEWESDSWSDEAGADGEVQRSRNNDNRATVVLTLLKSSESNTFLDNSRQLDENSGRGASSFTFEDLASGTIYSARDAWIMARPGDEYGQELGTREWSIRCANLEPVVRGIINVPNA